jgi:putative aldouronate transport system substrate-binding protein
MEMIPTGFLNLFWGKSYDERYTAWSPVFDQTFVDEAVMMKDWADKGYWRKDALNFTGDTRAELKAGKTGADAHHSQTYRGLRYDMDQSQPGSELQMFAYADTRGNLMTDSPIHGGISVGANSKNPERALMALELIHDDPEIYRLFQYGIEGEQYVIDENGKRTRPEGYDPAKDDFFSNVWGPRNDKNEIPSATEYAGIYDLFAHKAEIAKTYPYATFVFDKTPVQAELSALANVTTKYGPAIIWGKMGDPVKAVDEFREKLKQAGYDKVLAEVQKQLDAYKAQVGG